MSTKYPGGLITKNPVTPAGPYETGAAPGVWTVEQALQYTKQGIWPTAGNVPNYIEDVFSTYLYTGTGAAQTITNGIDLSGKGGLTWIKRRSTAADHYLCDTARGAGSYISSDTTLAQNYFGPPYNGLTAFNSNGFSLGSDTTLGWVNNNNETYVSWTFRKQPKFFDVVTWTGDGTGTRNIAHSLTSTPGAIFIKQTSSNTTWINWYVYHRANTGTPETAALFLNTTDSTAQPNSYLASTAPTSTQFTVTSGLNESTKTYVAYLFAHNAGGFGLTGTDNVISCGSFTTDGSGNATVNLGYEPQWVLYKKTSATGGWIMFDIMRGMTTKDMGNDAYLFANLSLTEGTDNVIYPTATGFGLQNQTGSETYIYIAIRRGPMKVPTSGTSVFAPVTYTGTSANRTITSPGFPVDFVESKTRNATYNDGWFDRLRGATIKLSAVSTGAEVTQSDSLTGFDSMTGYSLGADTAGGSVNESPKNYVNWAFRRAPSFFDEVCYTGTGTSGQTINHNLGVVPELAIFKSRSTGSVNNWQVYYNFNSSTYSRMILNTTSAESVINYGAGTNWLSQPTSTAFTCWTSMPNENTITYVGYLFATCAGVSKVGSYTGTGATQTISCGFTGGARFVLVKRTDSTGDWYVWDTARGMMSGTDPSLLLNSTAAEVNANSIYTTTGGFQIVSTAAGINASGGTYIFLAIA